MKKYQQIEECIKSLEAMYEEIDELRADAGTKSDKWDEYTQRLRELYSATKVMQSSLVFEIDEQLVAHFYDGDFILNSKVLSPADAYAFSLWVQLLNEEVK